MRNSYFENQQYKYTQRVAEDLVVEAIQIHGIDVYYLPKTFVAKDNLFGEDMLRKFVTAAPVEVYIKDSGGFGGEGDILSKFGLDIKDQMTFTMARRRFEQIRSEKIMLETGSNIILENGETKQPSFRTGNNSYLQLESGTANGYVITSSRPLEGDLLYIPLANAMFEISFVEHESPFYQFGALYTYDLTCNRFDYSSEKIDTGYAEVDRVELDNSFALDSFEMLTEDNNRMITEDGFAMIIEDFKIQRQDPIANNEFFIQQSDTILDFSEDNPFSESQ